jgi:restriction system protein
MAKRKDSFLELLVLAPWWVSIIVGIAAYIGLAFILPAQVESSKHLALLAAQMAKYAPFVALFFFFFGGLSAFHHRRSRRLVDQQPSLESLKSLLWKEFEWMVAEAYRRQGYAVEESLGGGPDGGIDLTLRKAGRTILVQCKRWKTGSVGAPVIREMFGILTDQGADEVIVVASGIFTREAMQFAQGKPIQLVEGPALLELLSTVQRKSAGRDDSRSEKFVNSENPPTCPKCGLTMVERVARRGKNAGNRFYGCSQYPKCKETQDMIVHRVE